MAAWCLIRRDDCAGAVWAVGCCPVPSAGPSAAPPGLDAMAALLRGSVGGVTVRIGRRTALLLAAGLVTGCATQGDEGNGAVATPGTTVSEGLLARIASELNAAVEGRDATRFARVFAAEAATTGRIIAANALALGAWRAEPNDGGLRIRTRAGTEPGWGSAEVTLNVDEAGRVTSIAERLGDHAVVWLHHAIEVLRQGQVWAIVATGRAASAQSWLAAAAEAQSRLIGEDWSAWRPDPAWDGSLVVELPADLLQFGEPAGIGAYVRLRGSDDDARIVCNPVDRPGLDDTGRAQLLTHEAVHAVTRSPARVAPGWVVEGYAEHGAERAFPDLEASNATLLPTDPDAAALPSDQAVVAGDLAVYALAARAVAGAQERWGRVQTDAWFADWQSPGRPDDAAFTDALRAALRR